MNNALRLSLMIALSLFGFVPRSFSGALNENTAASMAGNGVQFAASAADLAGNAPQCASGTNPTACVLMGLDILSMAGALMAMKGNEEAHKAAETEAPPAAPAAGAPSGAPPGMGKLPSLAGINSALGDLCKKSPSICSSCATKPDDPSCRTLKVPDAFAGGVANFLKDPKNLVGLPENLQEEGALEDALGKLANLPQALNGLNENLIDIHDALGKAGTGGENLSIAGNDDVASKPVIAQLSALPDLSDLLSQFRKQNEELGPVKFIGLDVEDLKTGKRLTLFERAHRRYQGSQDFPRAFTLARMELMRSRAVAEKLKIDKSIARKRAQAIAATKNAPLKH